jgi:hypothetical protein
MPRVPGTSPFLCWASATFSQGSFPSFPSKCDSHAFLRFLLQLSSRLPATYSKWLGEGYNFVYSYFVRYRLHVSIDFDSVRYTIHVCLQLVSNLLERRYRPRIRESWPLFFFAIPPCAKPFALLLHGHGVMKGPFVVIASPTHLHRAVLVAKWTIPLAMGFLDVGGQLDISEYVLVAELVLNIQLQVINS